MMGRTKKGRRSYSAGEWGRNRVRVFPDPRTGIMQVQWREHGRRLIRSLRHRDWDQAKQQADEIAAGLTEPRSDPADAEPEPLTLETLFDIYGDEVTPTKAKRSQRYDRAAMKRFLRFFGRHRKAKTLSQRDWDRFIRARRAGNAGGSRGPVSNRTVEYDLRFLLAILNWAAKSRDEEGRLLLESNPLRGLKLPKEKNPTRVILTQVEYEALLRVAGGMNWRFRVALVLAHETGHRIGAIRQLRWADIDRDGRTIRWRGEHEKTGYEHRTPVTSKALAALAEARRHNPGIGDTPVMPAPKDPFACMSRSLARVWWKRAEKHAELEPKRGRGWHSLRRKFASDLMDLPLKVLCDLGGWKTAETVLQCYQRPDENRLRKAIEEYRGVGIGSN
ncbi:tyrosine-type recombinase/integrase [Candidatus Palauibacter sp.]|uniref:tyrosine-type recombinase/integrase n=1 Tax=Candidatus Palauibacter sp. TaxID=3101350 RepID=UPI003B52C6F1